MKPSGLMILWLSLIISLQVSAQEGNLQAMRRKQHEIVAMTDRINQRLAFMDTINTKLDQQRSLILNDLKQRAQALKRPEYEAVMRQPGIQYQLNLLQSVDALNQALRQRMDQLHRARTTLDYLTQRTEDAIKLLEIIGQMDTQQLVAKVDGALVELDYLIDEKLKKPHAFEEKNNARLWREILNQLN